MGLRGSTSTAGRWGALTNVMPTNYSTAAIRYGMAIALAVFSLSVAGQAQQQAQQQVTMALLDAPAAHPADPHPFDAMEPVRPIEPIEVKPLPEAPSHRRFWDRENTL